jgi:tetratricopeptide (TPR) repeat protein
MRLAILALAFFLSFSARPQHIQDSDSLLQLYSTYPDDTQKVDLLYKKGFALRLSDIKSAFTFSQLCLSTAEKTESPKFIAKACNLAGVLSYRTGNISEAIYFHKRALNLRNEIKDEEGIAFSKVNLGNIYTDLKEYGLAESYYLHSMQIFQKLKNNLQLTNSLINLGVLKCNMKQNSIAFEYFLRALSLSETENDYESKAMCLNNIGFIYEEQGNLKEALEYYNESLEIKELMDSEAELSDSYCSIASVLLKMKEIDIALNYLETAEKIASSCDYSDGLVSVYRLSAESYASKKLFDSAFVYQNKLLKLKEKIYEAGLKENEERTEQLLVPSSRKVEESRFSKIIIPSLLLIIVFLLAIILQRYGTKEQRE